MTESTESKNLSTLSTETSLGNMVLYGLESLAEKNTNKDCLVDFIKKLKFGHIEFNQDYDPIGSYKEFPGSYAKAYAKEIFPLIQHLACGNKDIYSSGNLSCNYAKLIFNLFLQKPGKILRFISNEFSGLMLKEISKNGKTEINPLLLDFLKVNDHCIRVILIGENGNEAAERFVNDIDDKVKIDIQNRVQIRRFRDQQHVYDISSLISGYFNDKNFDNNSGILVNYFSNDNGQIRLETNLSKFEALIKINAGKIERILNLIFDTYWEETFDIREID